MSKIVKTVQAVTAALRPELVEVSSRDLKRIYGQITAK